jgi:hypothetical protein
VGLVRARCGRVVLVVRCDLGLRSRELRCAVGLVTVGGGYLGAVNKAGKIRRGSSRRDNTSR